MKLNLGWFDRANRRMRRRKAEQASVSAQVQQLEDRCMLSGATWSLSGGGTALRVNGSAASEVITVSDVGGMVEIDCDGVITSTGVATASLSVLQVYGRDGDDVLTADASLGTLNVQLYGLGGADTLISAAGNDFLRGGDGIDSYDAGAGNDVVYIDELDVGFVGGTGIDKLRAIDATAGVTLVATDFEDYAGTDFDDFIDASGSPDSIHSMQGFDGADTLIGGDGNDNIFGNDGDDMLFGGPGRDVLRGDEGADIMDGGADFDMVSYRTSPAGVMVDLMATSAAFDGFGGPDPVIVGVEGIAGSDFADELLGDGGDNVFFGHAGDDLIVGRGGADSMNGNSGIDTIDYFESPTGVTADLGSGAFTGGHATGDTATSIEDIFGSMFDDVLGGNAVSNMLVGLGGEDTLLGRGGDDFLDGGDDDDVLDGDAGTDMIDAGAGDDVVRADSDDDGSGLFTGGSGSDRLFADINGVAVDWSIGMAEFEIISGSDMGDIIDLSGSAIGVTINGRGGDDTITGGDAGDTVNGGGGADTIEGGLGGDIIRGNAGDDIMTANAGGDDGVRDRFFGGAGADTATLATLDTAAADVETVL